MKIERKGKYIRLLLNEKEYSELLKKIKPSERVMLDSISRNEGLENVLLGDGFDFETVAILDLEQSQPKGE